MHQSTGIFFFFYFHVSLLFISISKCTEKLVLILRHSLVTLKLNRQSKTYLRAS